MTDKITNDNTVAPNTSEAPAAASDSSAPNFAPKESVNEQDVGYVSDVNNAILASTPKIAQRLLYTIACFIVTALIWASFAEVEEVTRGAGKVIPSRQIQIVQNLEGGIVKTMPVEEGDVVGEGQLLMTLDQTRFLSDYREQQSKRVSLVARQIRLHAELASVNFAEEEGRTIVHVVPIEPNFDDLRDDAGLIVGSQRRYYQERIINLRNQLEILDEQIQQKKSALLELRSKIKYLAESYSLVNKEMELTKPLAKTGAVSEVELIKLQRQATEVQGNLENSKQQLPKLIAEVGEVSNRKEEVALNFRNEAHQRLVDIESELGSQGELLVSLKDRLNRTSIVSPVTGTIKRININTVGGVIQPGMDLIEIVPLEDSLLVEAKIIPKDIGFLRPQLNAVIKLTAYDFAIYGGLEGTVEHISADTIIDEKGDSYYLIRVRTEDSYYDKFNQPLPIMPGMTASVDVITGKKSVLSYLIKPIVRAKQSALREK